MKKDMSFWLQIVIAIFIAVFSFSVLSTKLPQWSFMESTVESLDESRSTVMKFAGTTAAASLAIAAVPGDATTPIADAMTDMNKYFVFILIVIFLERFIVIEGMHIALMYLIPFVCGFYIIWLLVHREWFKKMAYKLGILALALIFVIPVSTHFVDAVGTDYLNYVNQTIDETQEGTDKINEMVDENSDDATILSRISNAFSTLTQGASDVAGYFEDQIEKCLNSIAVLVVTTCVLPLVVLFFFRWLLKELFSIKFPELPLGDKSKHDGLDEDDDL